MIQPKTSHNMKRILRQMAILSLSFFGIFLLFCSAQASSMFSPLENLTSRAQQSLATFSQQSPTETKAETLPFFSRLFLSESPSLSSYGKQREVPMTTTTEQSEPDDDEDLDLSTIDPDNHIVSRTLSSGDPQTYLPIGRTFLKNRTNKTLDFSSYTPTPAKLAPSIDGKPQILIMHTHTTESFNPDGKDHYSETDNARTTDPNYNITRVGEEIARIFTEMGLSVVHDRTLHDYPNYNGSYERSRDTIERYLEEYPSIQVVLDIHRDALVGQDGTIYKPIVTIDNQETAQILLVLGTDDNGLHHPNWETNLGLAVRIQEQTNTLWPNLARPIVLRSNRFNQELTTGSILVEIGSHGNTLEEALCAGRLFARSAGQVLLDLQE